VYHSRVERLHRESCSRHRGLRHTYDVEGRKHHPSPAETSRDLGIYRTSEEIPGLWRNRDRAAFPSAARLQYLFSGPMPEGEEICLRKDAPPSKPPLQYSVKDVDSAIAIFSNLNSFRDKIRIQVVSQQSRLLEKSIHISYDLVVEGKMVPLHKIPHMLFATTDCRSHQIYSFFPALYSSGCSIRLSEKAHAAFYEKLLLPGLEGSRTGRSRPVAPAKPCCRRPSTSQPASRMPSNNLEPT
jgi:hypothetical protein